MTAPTTDRALNSWALVQRAQAGDRDAFAEIYRRYQDTVFRFVYFRTGNRQLAEDLTQDAFVRALKNINSFTWQGRDLGAWLIAIARNLIFDHYKSSHYRLNVTVATVLDLGADLHDERVDVERQAQASADAADLLTAMRELTEMQRRAVVMRYLNGLSITETGGLLGINDTATKSLLYRARHAMARTLTELYGETA